MSYYYLASPYTHKDPTVRQQRYEEVQYYTGLFVLNNLHIFSPIVHSHDLAVKYALPVDITFWKDYCEAMLQPALAIWVLQLPGWDDSNGIKSEIEFAMANKIPISYVDPLKPYDHLFLKLKTL